MLAKFYHETTIMKVVAKKNNGSKVLFSNAFWSADFVIFFPDFHKYSFTMKFCKQPQKISMFAKKNMFSFFLTLPRRI